MNNTYDTTLIPHELQQQQLGNTTKKKKCHGNRKKQRYRRQLYDQGLTTEQVDKLVEEKFSSQIQQQQQQLQLQVQQDMTPDQYNTQNIQVYIPLDRVCFF